MNRGRVGEERRGKETDGCPLTLPPLQSTASQCAKTARRLPGLVRGTPFDLYYVLLSLSLPSPIFPSSNPILYLTGSISTDCDHYGHSHVM
jgi:hypothetical protein